MLSVFYIKPSRSHHFQISRILRLSVTPHPRAKSAFACSKLAAKTLEQVAEYVQS